MFVPHASAPAPLMGSAGSWVGFVVTTMDVPWRLAQPRLGGTPVAVLFVENMEVETLDRQLAAAPECETVLAIGGGQAIDLGKYHRLETRPPLVSAPRF